MKDLSWAARLYLIGVFAAAALALAAYGVFAPDEQVDVTLLCTLLSASVLAQMFEVWAPNNKAYVATLSVLGAAAILLGPLAAASVATLPFVVEQLRKPKPWYIAWFNVASHVLSVLAAHEVLVRLDPDLSNGELDGTLASTGIALAAMAALLLVNHLSLVIVLKLARGLSPKETGLLSAEGLITDGCLLALGVVIAVLWTLGPPLLLFIVAPFVLLQRALHFPALTAASRTDGKTGLANATYWREIAEQTLSDAPVGVATTILVADLDLLRNINNTYGHLAGDMVLLGIADLLREELREEDLAARFGGEEFVALLPRTGAEEALEIAERLRTLLDAKRFPVSANTEPIRATVSVGIATSGVHGSTLDELIHEADVAVYRAKAGGRNQVVMADLSLSAGLGQIPSQVAVPVDDSPAPTPPLPEPTGTASTQSTQSTQTTGDAPAASVERVRPAGDATHLTSDRTPLDLPEAQPRRRPTRLLTAAVAFLALAVTPVIGVLDSSEGALPLAAFVLAALLAELAGERVYSSSAVSLSALVVLTAVADDHGLAAIVAAALSAMVGGLLTRRHTEQTIFNMGTLVLSAAAAVGVFALTCELLEEHLSGTELLLACMLPASLAYFAVDNGLVTVVVALDERRPVRAVGKDLFWLLPHFVAFGLIGAVIAGFRDTVGMESLLLLLFPAALMGVARHQYLARTTSSVSQLREAGEMLEEKSAELASANAALEEALEGVERRHLLTARTLARAIDARDATTGGHVERVCTLGLELVRSVDPILADDPQVSFGFLLHDVGKIGIPDHILLKDGPLTSDEEVIMRTHATIGADLLREADFGEVAQSLALHHHERWDGTGYPLGLNGLEIPLPARLFSVVDALDAMTNDRPYRKGMPLKDALREIAEGSGTQFDPFAVDALHALDKALIRESLKLRRDSALIV